MKNCFYPQPILERYDKTTQLESNMGYELQPVLKVVKVF